MNVLAPRRQILRGVGATLACVVAILMVVVAVNVIGIGIVGDVNEWTRWIQAHRLHFAAWRGLLYVLTTIGWWWMRSRVLDREPNVDARTRLRRTEIAAVLAISTLEAITFLQRH